MANTNFITWFFSSSIKIIFFVMAALSMLFMAKLVFLPSIVEFASLELPRMYDSFLTWLTPPYLLFFVNCIIVTIAATSHFQKNDPSSASTSLAPVSIDGDSYCHMKTGLTEMGSPVQYVDEEEVKVAGSELITPVEHFEHFETFEAFGGVSKAAAVVMEETKSVEEEEEFVISRSNWTPIIRRGSGEIYSGEEKAPVSSRFGSRKSVKASPDGKVLGVMRPKKNETMESTWKMMTDGRPIPLSRHLKKSETLEATAAAHRGRGGDKDSAPSPTIIVKKKRSESFNERRKNDPSSPSPGSSGGGRFRNLSQDELNRRVEAFINKFNQEMRLQRRQSSSRGRHYRNMVHHAREVREPSKTGAI
ncbi:hypothetical protein ZOSMA_433G00010 [Zostera marina]|uniref:DUF4408 domain-containing protein n=1 Tax=Zostera marina TaxID=29655 RepID=A0A0K9P3X3_ZOSMR|nr:hypothetical protein ZOSMA_433G00010 [Zostera marina]